MTIDTLIGECTAYDFKLMLEERRPKSWLKSVSAFANGIGGSLFFGIDDEGCVRGLDDVQHVCEAISSKIRDYMDPLPEVEMIPHTTDGANVLQLKVNAGSYTPYYYVGDGQRVAFVRVGDESLPATAEQMVRLVLKGTNKTFDSLHTDYRAEDYSFTILANTFKARTHQEWDKKYLLSFGLVTHKGNLTNAGALLDYMEKRGSGLTRICNETKSLEGYRDDLRPVFKSTPTQFQTTIFASAGISNVGDDVGDLSDTKLTARQLKMLNLIRESPAISGRQMSEILSVSQRTIERDLSALQKLGILRHEGKDNAGVWIINKG